jgi:hypothetical protein
MEVESRVGAVFPFFLFSLSPRSKSGVKTISLQQNLIYTISRPFLTPLLSLRRLHTYTRTPMDDRSLTRCPFRTCSMSSLTSRMHNLILTWDSTRKRFDAISSVLSSQLSGTLPSTLRLPPPPQRLPTIFYQLLQNLPSGQNRPH